MKLTPSLKVPEKRYQISQLGTKNLFNRPGIYAWRCKKNNKYLIGETKNLKNRIPQHLTSLKNGDANKEFLKDFNTFGPDSFELIIFEEGPSCVDYIYRKDIERKLSTELSIDNLCYNKIFCETKTERPKGKFPSSPGIYCIRCVVNDYRYYGETGQRKGLAGRIAKWKHKLRSNQEKNLFMQEDWNNFGEESFEFLVIESGIEWEDKEKRKKREKELCNLHQKENGVLYNVFPTQKYPSVHLKAKETILTNQSKEFREFISKQNTGRPNVNRKAIFAEGNVYLSIVEASKALDLNRALIRKKIATELYRYATTEEIQREEERRASLSVGFEKVEVLKKDKGKAKRCRINGVDFNSLSEAASSLGVSVQAISKNLSQKREGYYYIDEQGNPII